MININSVYQKVLAITNKEQRGYITPQEFNLFANQAQMEIFEQYFYDLNQFNRIPGNDTPYADVDTMLEEKLQIFESFDERTTVNNYASAANQQGLVNALILPDYIYRVSRVLGRGNNEAEIVNTKDFDNIRRGGYLTFPTDDRPIVNIRNNEIRILWTNKTVGTWGLQGIYYFRIPNNISWGYVVIGGTAMWDNTTTTHCELHAAEETELVHKILKYAGISMKRNDIMSAGQGMEIANVQQEKQ